MKHFRTAAALILMLTLLSSMALADELTAEDGPEWTFEVSLTKVDSSLLTVVSAESPLTAQDVPSNLVALKTRHNNNDGINDNGGIYKASNAQMQLCESAELALTTMFGAAENQGVILYIRQGYRSYEDLAKRYAAAESKGSTAGVPKAGESDYQTGMAASVVGKEWRTKALTAEFADSAEGQWLAENAVSFGFVIDADEPWHLRYVGTNVSYYMKRNHLDVAGFVAALEQAKADYVALGGDLNNVKGPAELPEGAVELEAVGPDGDHEITIFHD